MIFLWFRSRCFLLLLLSTMAIGMPQPGFTDEHGKLRMYKLNSKGQPVRQKWLKDTEEEGCHTSFRSREVYRFAQLGFEFCTLYSQDDCAAGSEVPATWGGRKYVKADFDIEQPQNRLLEGTEWYLHPEENIEISSWYCEYAQ